MGSRKWQKHHKCSWFIDARISRRILDIFDGHTPPEVLRILGHVKRAPSGCWEWQAYIMPTTGYGQVLFGGVVMTSHRAMLTATTGVWMPPHVQACHKCDNRKCVNPDHLFWGTAKDNMQDCKAKGRNRRGPSEKWRGSLVANAKLTEEQVAEIRRIGRIPGVSLDEHAARYRVTRGVLSKILNGSIWKHVIVNTTQGTTP